MPLKKKSQKKKRTVKRKITKKTLKKRPLARKKKAAVVKKAKKVSKKEKIIGKITHYFPKVRAGVIKLKMPLTIGDVIKIKGHTTDFKQTVTSLQIDRVPIKEAKKGQEIGLLVDSRVRKHDTVYKA